MYSLIMLKYVFYFFILQFIIYMTSSNSITLFSILFIHIGDKFLQFQKVSMTQARLFNPKNKIYLLVSETYIQKKNNIDFLEKYNVTCVTIQSLAQTEHHKRFNNIWLSKPNRRIYEFWHYTTERFFLIEEFMMVCHHYTSLQCLIIITFIDIQCRECHTH